MFHASQLDRRSSQPRARDSAAAQSRSTRPSPAAHRSTARRLTQRVTRSSGHPAADDDSVSVSRPVVRQRTPARCHRRRATVRCGPARTRPAIGRCQRSSCPITAIRNVVAPWEGLDDIGHAPGGQGRPAGSRRLNIRGHRRPMFGAPWRLGGVGVQRANRALLGSFSATMLMPVRWSRRDRGRCGRS